MCCKEWGSNIHAIFAWSEDDAINADLQPGRGHGLFFHVASRIDMTLIVRDDYLILRNADLVTGGC